MAAGRHSTACHTFHMETQAMEDARRWLAERGVVEVGAGWVGVEGPERPLTANEIAHSWAA